MFPALMVIKHVFHRIRIVFHTESRCKGKDFKRDMKIYSVIF